MSSLVYLNAGTEYYIELLHKEGSGGDSWGVFWCPPSVTTPQPIQLYQMAPIIPNCGPSTTCSGNLITSNAGFESGFTGYWTSGNPSTTNVSPASGSYSAVICNLGGAGIDMPCTPGATYTFSASCKINGTNYYHAAIGISYYTANWDLIYTNYPYTATVTSTSYQTYTVSAPAPANAAYIDVSFWNNSNSGVCFYADNFCLTKTAPSCNNTALLVVGNTTLSIPDQNMKNRLTNLGITVTVKSDAAVTTADATGKGLVLISASVDPVNVGSKFTTVNVPVINCEAFLHDDMKMTGATSNVDYFYQYHQSGKILLPTHPIANGLNGTYVLTDYAVDYSWGKPTWDAMNIMEFPDMPGKTMIFAYETGDQMIEITAPARRVGFCFYTWTAQHANANAWKLFDGAVKWAMNCVSLNNLALAVNPSSLTFNAYRETESVQLKWIQRTNGQNDYFEIERAGDDQVFHSIATFDGKANADEMLYFTEYDHAPLEGVNQYRIKVVSLDGTVEYSVVKTVEFNTLKAFEVFPNPAKNEVFVNLKPTNGAETMIRMFDHTGRFISQWTRTSADGAPVQLELGDVKSGQYLLWIQAEGMRPVSQKLLIENNQ